MGSAESASHTRRVRPGRRVARALLSAQFVRGGYLVAKDAGSLPAALERAGVPGGETLVRLNGLAMLVGGCALALGVKPRLAALGLAASLVPTTIVGHPFWKEDDPAVRSAQKTQFMKGLTMLGGLILEAATPSTTRPPR